METVDRKWASWAAQDRARREDEDALVVELSHRHGFEIWLLKDFEKLPKDQQTSLGEVIYIARAFETIRAAELRQLNEELAQCREALSQAGRAWENLLGFNFARSQIQNPQEFEQWVSEQENVLSRVLKARQTCPHCGDKYYAQGTAHQCEGPVFRVRRFGPCEARRHNNINWLEV